MALTTKKQWDERNPIQVDIIEEGFRLCASARIVRQLDTVIAQAEIVDISHEGASLAGRRPPEPDEEIKVILKHDGDADRLIKVTARVARHTESGSAVRFDNPTREVRGWITKLRSFRRLDD